MSANLKIELLSEPAGEMAEALYFGSGDHSLFGWLHRPATGRANDLGVVLCNPFGYEAICSHRSVRAFAEGAAAAGSAALRFDYRGTGDSADLDPDADQLDAWTQDVVMAVAELRGRTGVRRVCLLGFRFGALLAALAAPECHGVCGLIAIAPIASGRRHVRELRTARLAAMLAAGPPAAIVAPIERAAAGTTPLEVGGFSLSPATLAALGQVDLCAPGTVPAPRILMIDGDRLPTGRAWAERLAQAGAETTYRALPGMVEMLMTAPQFAVVPRAMIAEVATWLSSFGGAPESTEYGKARTGAIPVGGVKSVMTVRSIDGRLPAALVERAVRFGPDAALFGIVTEPPREERRRRAVILLNPGVDHHIGASRLYVSFARQWASRGYVVLRMDLAGIGDSDTRAGNPDDDVFPASALDDIRAGIDHLGEHYRAGDISLVGLCSGAYHALRAAAAGVRVQRILMINPQNYFWKKGMSLTDLQLVEVMRNPGVYRKQILSAAAWKRLVGGEVNLARIVKVYLQRLTLAAVSASRSLAKHLNIRLTYDLGRDLEEIAAGGVAIVFVFARGEPGLDLLYLEGGPAVGRLGRRCQIHILEKGDHVFSHRESRAALDAVLADELFRKVVAPAAGRL
jgi:alpha-beta hydrolase superfamily lysophospholipase